MNADLQRLILTILILGVLVWVSSMIATADTLEVDHPTKICQVIHSPGSNPVVMEVPDKNTLSIKEGIVTFIDVNGNQLWVSQPFIVRVPEQAERRFE